MEGVSGKIKLSAKRIGELGKYLGQHDFEFIVDQQHYQCSWLTACFLSDKVCQLRKTDSTITSYEVETKDPDGHFKDLLSLGEGNELVLDAANWGILLSLCEELGNRELASLLCNSVELNGFTVIKQLKRKENLKMDITNEIEFLAKQFDTFLGQSDEVLGQLSVSLLSEILSNPSVRLKSENSLYTFVSEIAARNAEYFSLFEFVRFEFLSVVNIESFCVFARNFLNEINVSIWDRISERLVSPPKSICNVKFNSKAGLNGIIALLTDQNGGNVHSRGIVKVTAKSVWGGCLPEHIANLTDDSEYHSENAPDQWVCYDFQNMKLCPT
jgi:hypothetical protein